MPNYNVQAIANDALLPKTDHGPRPFVLIIASILFLYIVFSPAINILYYSGDDFKYSFGGYWKSCTQDGGYHFMMAIGRPMQSLVDCLNFKYGFTLEHMRDIRVGAIVLMGCGMGLFADWLCTLGFATGIAFFAAACLFLIEHLYGDTVPMGATSLPFAVLLAILAYRCVVKSHFYAVHHRRLQRVALLCAGSLLILFALLTYPAMAFFFGVMMLTKVLFSPLTQWPAIRKEILQEMLVFCVMGVIYFAWAAYFMHHYTRMEIPSSYQLSHPNLNPIEMLKRLQLLGNVFSTWWSVSPRSDTDLQGWVMIICLIIGIICGISSLRAHVFCRRGNPEISSGSPRLNAEQPRDDGIKITILNRCHAPSLSTLVQALLLVSLLIIFNCAFFLVMPDLTLVENRVLFAAVLSGFVLVFWSIVQVGVILPAQWGNKIVLSILVVFCLIEAHQANIVTMLNAVSHQAYLNADTVAISNFLASGKKLRAIHFVIPRSDYPLDRYSIANAALTPIAGAENYEVHWCGQASAAHCLALLPNNAIAITYSYEGETFNKFDTMLVIKNHFVDADIKI